MNEGTKRKSPTLETIYEDPLLGPLLLIQIQINNANPVRYPTQQGIIFDEEAANKLDDLKQNCANIVDTFAKSAIANGTINQAIEDIDDIRNNKNHKLDQDALRLLTGASVKLYTETLKGLTPKERDKALIKKQKEATDPYERGFLGKEIRKNKEIMSLPDRMVTNIRHALGGAQSVGASIISAGASVGTAIKNKLSGGRS